jgi:ADP-ribose pyrophosphatase YjhB (NUDIX family)
MSQSGSEATNLDLHSLLVNAVVFKDGKVLISQRSWDESHEPGKWTIPGGKVGITNEETFSVLEKNIAKEVKEETGVGIENDMQLISNNTFIRSSDNQHVVVLVFKCKYKSGETKPLEDTIDCKWVTKEETEDLDFPPSVKGYIFKAFEK